MASPRASSSLFPSSSPRALSSLAPVASPRASWKIEEGRNAELSHPRYTELKFVSDNQPDMPDDDYGFNMNAKRTFVNADARTEEMNEESAGGKTPNYVKGNKFFGIPLTESIAGSSPRWSNYKPPKKTLIEKSDLFPENLDESSTDANTMIQQLKKQLSDNRKTLLTLYMELDEERSAAAVAANNAMAMITRLQADKASVQMEALQYQRMMDEQAEYDEEAIQILRDLFLKKEEDVKELEAELEIYRERYGELKKFDSDEFDIDVDEYYDELQPRSLSSLDDRPECGSVVEGDENRRGNHDLNFETERSQLFGMLKDFENQICSSNHHDDKHTGKGNNDTLWREVDLMREKLGAIEAESGFLKQTAMTLEKGDQGTKLLTEIAEHLRKLPGPEKPKDPNTIDAEISSKSTGDER